MHLVRLGIDTGCDGGREAVVLLTLWHCLEIFCKFGSWMLCAIYDVRRRHKSASNSGSSLYISWLVWLMCDRCDCDMWWVWLWCVAGVTLVCDWCDFGVWQVWLWCMIGVTLVCDTYDCDRCDCFVWQVWLWCMTDATNRCDCFVWLVWL